MSYDAATVPSASSFVLEPERDWQATFRSMASDVHVRIGPTSGGAADSFAAVVRLFDSVHKQCTRFDPDSDLMRANSCEGEVVGRYCFAALEMALAAHQKTAGLFDPRVLRTLCDLGYRDSYALGRPEAEAMPAPRGAAPEPWDPQLDRTTRRVWLGPDPIDLGGIGKGLAVRWGTTLLARSHGDFLLDAGGDLFAAGVGPDGDGWHIGIEDPRGQSEPIAVLTLADMACATSSIRLRNWLAGGEPAHHLIDPRTGRPGGTGLLSVTVVHRDPAEAEVMSKVLFLHGADEIADAAEPFAAYWVDVDGSLGVTEQGARHLIWQAA